MAATHSPLIMASIEPEFTAVTDAWFDLDFEEGGVVLRRREFQKRGDAATWLISEAFDLPPDGSQIRELVAVAGGSMVHCTLPRGLLPPGVG